MYPFLDIANIIISLANDFLRITYIVYCVFQTTAAVGIDLG